MPGRQISFVSLQTRGAHLIKRLLEQVSLMEALTGINYKSFLTPEQLDVSYKLHGEAMSQFGYEIVSICTNIISESLQHQRRFYQIFITGIQFHLVW